MMTIPTPFRRPAILRDQTTTPSRILTMVVYLDRSKSAVLIRTRLQLVIPAPSGAPPLVCVLPRQSLRWFRPLAHAPLVSLLASVVGLSMIQLFPLASVPM